MKIKVLHTVWCNNTGEAEGEIWHWSLMGVKGLKNICRCYLLRDCATKRGFSFNDLTVMLIIGKPCEELGSVRVKVEPGCDVASTCDHVAKPSVLGVQPCSEASSAPTVDKEHAISRGSLKERTESQRPISKAPESSQEGPREHQAPESTESNKLAPGKSGHSLLVAMQKRHMLSRTSRWYRRARAQADSTQSSPEGFCAPKSHHIDGTLVISDVSQNCPTATLDTRTGRSEMWFRKVSSSCFAHA